MAAANTGSMDAMLGRAVRQQATTQVTQGLNAAGMTGQMNAKGQKREFLFCIPLQVGPTTAYAKSKSHWMLNILIIQGLCAVARIAALLDIGGGLWMILTCAIGVYAYREDLNITYVCCWGLLSLLNGVLDIISAIFPLIIGLLTLNVLQSIVRFLVPLGYLLGAAFAWHLYRDYEAQETGQVPEIPVLGDPFGHMVGKFDAENQRLHEEQIHKPPQQAPGYGGVEAGGAAPQSTWMAGGWSTMGNSLAGASGTAQQQAQAGQQQAQAGFNSASSTAVSTAEQSRAGAPGAAATYDVKSNPFLT